MAALCSPSHLPNGRVSTEAHKQHHRAPTHHCAVAANLARRADTSPMRGCAVKASSQPDTGTCAREGQAAQAQGASGVARCVVGAAQRTRLVPPHARRGLVHRRGRGEGPRRSERRREAARAERKARGVSAAREKRADSGRARGAAAAAHELLLRRRSRQRVQRGHSRSHDDTRKTDEEQTDVVAWTTHGRSAASDSQQTCACCFRVCVRLQRCWRAVPRPTRGRPRPGRYRALRRRVLGPRRVPRRVPRRGHRRSFRDRAPPRPRVRRSPRVRHARDPRRPDACPSASPSLLQPSQAPAEAATSEQRHQHARKSHTRSVSCNAPPPARAGT